jgi:hypothetical protein
MLIGHWPEVCTMKNNNSEDVYYLNGKQVSAGIGSNYESGRGLYWIAYISEVESFQSIHLKSYDSQMSAARWLSKTLDNKPKKFGNIDLRDHEMQVATQTAIRADGAEHYVMSYLMLAYGIVATRANRNMPGYDILAYLPETGKSCRIQVKYRESRKSILLENSDFDFLVLVTDCHATYEKQKSADGLKDETREIKSWGIYVAPRERIDSYIEEGKSFTIRYSNYFMNWKIIFDYLS